MNLTEKKYYPIDAYYSYKDNKLYYIVKEVDENGNSKKLVGYKDNPEYSISIGKFSKNIKYIESLDNKIKDLKLTYKEYNYLKRSLVKAYDGKKNLKASKKFTEILSHQYDIYDDYRIETKFLQQEIFKYDNDYLNNIKIGVWDIEVYHDDKEFPEPEQAKYIIDSISHIDIQNNEIHIYFLYNEQHHSNIENFEEKVYEKLKEEYGLEFYYKLHIFKTEQDLLINYLNYISKFDVMIGWNSLNFDTLYVYNRCKKLKISKHFENAFGEMYQTLNIVDSKNGMNSYTYYTTKILSIDYIHLIKFYDKTNYPSYSLNKIAEKVLKKSEDSITAKIEVQNLNVEYLSNPVNFINYNVGDVIINKFIDDKLLFIRILFKQKMMTRGFTAATLSINNILDAYISTEAKKNNKMCISAIKVQNFYTKKIWYIYRRLNFLTDTRLELIQKIREDNKTFSLFTNVNELEEINYDISSFSEKDLEDVNNIKLSKSKFPFIWEQDKYPGAYVKKPDKGIHLNVIDFDASLPPWEYIYIKRNNNIKKIKIGDYEYINGDLTLTWDYNDNICWRYVLGKIEHDWNDKLVKIKTITDKEITVTNNHSMFGLKKENIGNKYTLIDADNLNINDYVLSNIDNNVELERIKEIKYFNYVGKVYDISVEETERFIAGTGICAHNTSMYPSSIYATNNGCDSWVYQVPENLALLYLYEREKFYSFVNENENLTIEIYDVINDKFKQFKHLEIIEIFDKIFEKELVLTETGAVFIPAHIEESFFRKLIRKPIFNRQQTKAEKERKEKELKLKSDDPEILNLHITQLVLKIIANSVYGYLGFRRSRLFNIILATTITMNCQFMIRYVAINSDRIIKNINDVE